MNKSFGLTRAPSTILFGEGQRHALGSVTSHIGKRALICTDERLSASPLLVEMLQDLTMHGVTYRVFDGTQPELPSDGIEICVQQNRAFNPDVIIGLGGGSCLDMAKLVALCLAHDGPLEQYYGELKVPGPVLPVIAIPTTAGTGSEITPVAVMADKKRDLKVGISSPYLIPHTAICDPELTMTCPPGLTALSGADALTHAIEAFTAVVNPVDAQLSQTRVFVGKNLLSDQHALTAIKAIFEFLPRAVNNGADAEARRMLMFGSLQAGLAFGVAGTAAAHAIQYPVGALTNTAHGLGVAALLPYVMRFNAETHPQAYEAIARAIGITTLPAELAVEQLIQQTQQLLTNIGIPRTLADLGVQAGQLDWISEQSLLSARLINNNPRHLQLRDIKILTERAFHGHI